MEMFQIKNQFQMEDKNTANIAVCKHLTLNTE